MTRSTVTTYMKALGGKLQSKGSNWTVYELPTEEAVLKSKEELPFGVLWTTGNNVTVFFDQVK